MNAYKVVDTELIEDLSKPDKEPDKEKRVEREGDSKPGKLPKKELNKLLVSAIVRRLKKLYFSVPKSEDRILCLKEKKQRNSSTKFNLKISLSFIFC